jgi:hypothetical protein
MGAELCVRSYDRDYSKKEVQELVVRETKQMAYEDGNSYSGTWASSYGGVTFPTKEVFDCSNDAEEYIAENHEKGNCVMALKFTIGNSEGWCIGGWCSS